MFVSAMNPSIRWIAFRAVVYVVLLALLGVIAVSMFSALAEFVVGAVGLATSVIAAIFQRSIDRIHEREKEARRLQQANYEGLLVALGDFAEKQSTSALRRAHAESWAFAPASVVDATAKFIIKPGQNALAKILIAMRNDIGLDAVKQSSAKALYLAETKTTRRGFDR